MHKRRETPDLEVSLQITITEEPMASLAEYATISSAFEVRSVLELSVRAGGLGGISLCEQDVLQSFTKDYDALEGGPEGWATRFDTTRWTWLTASAHGKRVGGAVVVHDGVTIDMLEGRRDLAVLWDLRVALPWRKLGVGKLLFDAAERCAKARGCCRLKVETQNINVPACRFCARMGCRLGVVDPSAYPELPGEAQLLWFKAL